MKENPMLKHWFGALLLASSLTLSSCSDKTVEGVKTGVLQQYPQYRIGDKLDATFDDGRWKSFEKDGGNFVSYQAKISKAFSAKMELLVDRVMQAECVQRPVGNNLLLASVRTAALSQYKDEFGKVLDEAAKFEGLSDVIRQLMTSMKAQPGQIHSNDLITLTDMMEAQASQLQSDKLYKFSKTIWDSHHEITQRVLEKDYQSKAKAVLKANFFAPSQEIELIWRVHPSGKFELASWKNDSLDFTQWDGELILRQIFHD
jgi:hypothetical protein